MVGFYLDDTPLGSSGNYARSAEFGLDLMPYDVERVEVLRGPQGTLYGSGSMGGLLKYVLRSPDLVDFQVRAGADGSSTHGADDLGWGARGAVNIPIVSDRLALWMSYAKQDLPGYIDNALTGTKDENAADLEAGRASLLWQLNDDASLKLGGVAACGLEGQRCHVSDADRCRSADRRCEPRRSHQLSSARGAVQEGARLLLGDAQLGSGRGEPGLRLEFLQNSHAAAKRCVFHFRSAISAVERRDAAGGGRE